MPTEVKTPPPTSAADAHGRLIPETPEERGARAARIMAALDRIEAKTYTPEEVAAWRAGEPGAADDGAGAGGA